MKCIYNKVTFDDPSTDWDLIEIEWVVKDYSFVKKEDVLGSVKYRTPSNPLYPIESRKEQVFKVVSPCDGFFYIIQRSGEFYIRNKNNMDYWDNKLFASIFDSIQELFSYEYCCEGSTLERDPYTGLRRIEWKNPENIELDNGDDLRVEFNEDKLLICFYYIHKKLQIGDCVSFLFDNGKIIDFPIVTKPEKHHYGCETSFVLYQEDVEALMNSNLVSYRVTYKGDSKRPDTYKMENSGPHIDEEIRAYVKNRIGTLKQLIPDYQLPRRTVAKTPIEYKFNWCYVYLMRDNSNGYHKIGISNTPEYREKTLQSEKPSIEMLACKKFPTRKIAEAIESALHTAYSLQRVRGEWFNLDDVDVAAIIETLK